MGSLLISLIDVFLKFFIGSITIFRLASIFGSMFIGSNIFGNIFIKYAKFSSINRDKIRTDAKKCRADDLKGEGW